MLSVGMERAFNYRKLVGLAGKDYRTTFPSPVCGHASSLLSSIIYFNSSLSPHDQVLVTSSVPMSNLEFHLFNRKDHFGGSNFDECCRRCAYFVHFLGCKRRPWFRFSPTISVRFPPGATCFCRNSGTWGTIFIPFHTSFSGCSLSYSAKILPRCGLCLMTRFSFLWGGYSGWYLSAWDRSYLPLSSYAAPITGSSTSAAMSTYGLQFQFILGTYGLQFQFILMSSTSSLAFSNSSLAFSMLSERAMARKTIRHALALDSCEWRLCLVWINWQGLRFFNHDTDTNIALQATSISYCVMYDMWMM